MIQQLKLELVQLQQTNSTYDGNLQQKEQYVNQLTVENHELILKMQQLKDLFERHDKKIKCIYDKINQDKTIS